MNTHAQALGRLGGLANKGKPKSEAHKLALRKVLEASRNGSRKPLEASKPALPSQVKEAIPEVPKPLPEPKRCQSSYCTKVGREVLVQGMKAWLCEAHGCPPPYTPLLRRG